MLDEDADHFRLLEEGEEPRNSGSPVSAPQQTGPAEGGTAQYRLQYLVTVEMSGDDRDDQQALDDARQLEGEMDAVAGEMWRGGAELYSLEAFESPRMVYALGRPVPGGGRVTPLEEEASSGGDDVADVGGATSASSGAEEGEPSQD